MFANLDQLATAMVGKQHAIEFGKYLRHHAESIVNFLKDVADPDAKNELYENAKDIADLLCEDNPAIEYGQIGQLLYDFVNAIVIQIESCAEGHPEKSLKMFDKSLAATDRIADYLAKPAKAEPIVAMRPDPRSFTPHQQSQAPPQASEQDPENPTSIREFSYKRRRRGF
jgi:hypothetical protein